MTPLIFGYYPGDQLMYAARTRNGFTPASRAQLYRLFRDLEIPTCPFHNLPEARSGRWGEGLTADKMREEAFRERLQIILPILIVLGVVAYFYAVR